MTVEQDPRWHLLNDTNANGQFIYGVITTGIYCRPGCPSRRPNPDNVRFFDNSETAEAAGFRPCKRCRPQHASAQALEIERITAICRYIENAEHQPDLAELAEYSGWSSHHLQKVFKKITGVSPKIYARQIQQRLHQQPIIASRRAKGKTMTIEYTIGKSSLGNILAAWSTKGICAILIDDDSQALIEDLHQRFPQASIIHTEKNHTDEIRKIIAHVEHPAATINLPLDIQGTLFQQRVWKALQQIPCGETRSYTDIANAIGSPSSVRAVAGACAANSIAVLIPCHRVLRQDGHLSGYRWGVERKAELLKKEKQQKNQDDQPEYSHYITR